MKRILSLLAILTVAGLFTVASATPVTLGWLIDNNGSITNGDKTFSDFTAVITASGVTSPADAYGIAVTPVFLAGKYGLQLSGAISAICGGSTACPSMIDLLVGWNVSAAGYMITGVDLSFNGNANPFPSVAEVVEDVYNVNNNALLGHGSVTTGPPPALQTTIWLSEAMSQVRIQKDILAFAYTQTTETSQSVAIATISEISQLYHQEIPEPGTYAMIGLGLAGLGFLRRRKA